MNLKFLLAMILTMVMVAQTAQAQTNKALIVYYSRSGNTKEIALQIQKTIGGELFEIQTVQTYPEEYNTLTQQAKKEITEGYLPELKEKAPDLSQYDVVFIGSPNWWGTLTPAVSSFLAKTDLANKTVVPFITHGGGYTQNTLDHMEKQCKNCHVQKGFVVLGKESKNAQNDVNTWLKEINVISP